MFPIIIFVCILMCAMYAISRVADKMTVGNPILIMRPFATVEQYMRIRQRIPIEESVRALPRFVPASAAQDFGIATPTNPVTPNSRSVHLISKDAKKVGALKPIDVIPVADIQLAKASDFGVTPQTQFIYSPSGVLNLARAKDFGL